MKEGERGGKGERWGKITRKGRREGGSACMCVRERERERKGEKVKIDTVSPTAAVIVCFHVNCCER